MIRKIKFLFRPSIIRLHWRAYLAAMNENYGKEDKIDRQIGSRWAAELDRERLRRRRTTPADVASNGS
jgi:hypothetical protein